MAELTDQRDDSGALLVAACRRDANAARLASAVLLNDKARCEQFATFALDHGVRGLVFEALLRSGVVSAPGPRSVIDGMLRNARRRGMLLQLERDHVVSALNSRSIPTVVLKGAGLVSTAFTSAAERDYGDIDILVHPGDVSAAVDALAAQGYVGSDSVNAGYLAHHFHVRVQRPGGTIVEIHWGLTNANEPFHLDPGAFMSECVPHDRVPGARVPRPEHSLLHVVAENGRDAFTRFTRLVDVDRIVAAAPAMDWAYLEAGARKAGLLPTLSLALETSARLLGTEVPATVLQRIQSPPLVRRHVALLDVPGSLISRRGLRRPSWSLLLQLWLVDDRSRARAFARLYRGDDFEELDWLWAGNDEGSAERPRVAQRMARMGKLVAYQIGTYTRMFTA